MEGPTGWPDVGRVRVRVEGRTDRDPDVRPDPGTKVLVVMSVVWGGDPPVGGTSGAGMLGRLPAFPEVPLLSCRADGCQTPVVNVMAVQEIGGRTVVSRPSSRVVSLASRRVTLSGSAMVLTA